MKEEITIFDNEYSQFLSLVKQEIDASRIQAARKVNKELIKLYWWLGKEIVISQDKHGWGSSVVERLSKDLKKEFPGKSGFSERNLWLMRQIYEEYKEWPNLQQLVAEIPWGQNILILTKVKDIKAREYYLNAVIDMGWTRNVLLNQIKSSCYERHLTENKKHNFKKALPSHLAEQADLALKDSYVLDFLGIRKPIIEVELERKITEKIQEVILELGYGFSFIGNQFRVKAGDNDYFIDLLFYNRKIKCLVAIELKTGKFKPEYAGKMNFYLNLLDDFVREEGENPSIGIIMCAERDHIEVEYALRDVNKPIGVSEYHLTKSLPKDLRKMLPDAKKLEEQIRKELDG